MQTIGYVDIDYGGKKCAICIAVLATVERTFVRLKSTVAGMKRNTSLQSVFPKNENQLITRI